MKITLIYVTARLGGLDLLFESIRAQTMPPEDFELIIVDDWHENRWREVVAKKPIRWVLHLPPKQTGISYHNSASFNTGLAAARGELVIFLVDFVWLPPDFLECHWSFYKNHPGYSLSVYVDRYKYPPFAANLNAADNAVSIFEMSFDGNFADSFLIPANLIYQERKGGLLDAPIGDGCFEMPGGKIYMLGDSIPLAVMKELNGGDERYDGGDGANDLDVGMRANIAGWKVAVDLAAPT